MGAFSFGRRSNQLAAERKLERTLLDDRAAHRRTYETLRAHLTHLRDTDMAKLPYTPIWAKVRTGLFTEFENVLGGFDKVDSGRLMAEDIELLKTAVYTSTSEAVLRSTQEAAQHWAEPGRYTSQAKQSFKEAYRTIEQVIRKQFDPDYASGSTGGEEVDLTRLIFPQQAFDSPELQQALRTLEKTWRAAVKNPTSVEDRYLLEQIASSWLPESWGLIRGFESYSEQLRVRVEANVLEQLALITEQVQELLERNQQAFIGRLEAHTQFLRERRRGQLPSGLSLERSDRTEPARPIILKATPLRDDEQLAEASAASAVESDEDEAE